MGGLIFVHSSVTRYSAVYDVQIRNMTRRLYNTSLAVAGQ